MAASDSGRMTVLLTDARDAAGIGLRTLLGNGRRIAVWTSGRRDAAEMARRLRPQLIVLDPEAGGRLELGRVLELRAASPESRLCVHTGPFDPQRYFDVMQSGVRGYFLKGRADGAFLREGLMLVGRDGAVVCDPAVAAFFDAHPEEQPRIALPRANGVVLSAREREVLALLAAGVTDQEVAARLQISASTVQTHVKNLSVKLGAATRIQLGVAAHRLGLAGD